MFLLEFTVTLLPDKDYTDQEAKARAYDFLSTWETGTQPEKKEMLSMLLSKINEETQAGLHVTCKLVETSQ